MSESSTDVPRDIWARQHAWSRAAERARAEVSRYRMTSLVLVVLAAVLGAASPVVVTVDDAAGRMCGLVAGVCLGLIPLVRRHLGAPIYETWSRLRSISEALKVEVYAYLVGVEPYHGDDQSRVLRARATEILRKADDLLGRLRRSELIERELPAVTDVESYLSLRVEQQIRGYYLPRAHRMARRAHQVRMAQTLLAFAAVVLGVLASAGQTGVAPWIGVIGTVSGAVIAHSAAARYGFLQLEYFRTAEQLARIVAEYRHAGSTRPELADQLVNECERVISFQNEAWMAELVTIRQVETEDSIPPPV